MQTRHLWGPVAAARRWLGIVTLGVLLNACGGGGGDNASTQPPVTTNPPVATDIADCDASDFQRVLFAVPVATAAAVAVPDGMVRLHYRRGDGQYGNWKTYAWNAPGEALGGWPGIAPTGNDDFGAYWDIPVSSPEFNFILHDGTTREPSAWSQATGDQQQFWKVADGKEIWKLAGDKTQYASNPLLATGPNLSTVRVHYRRYDGNYSGWGLHLWSSNGIDTARMPASPAIGDWAKPVPLSAMPGYTVSNGTASFDIPVLNPKDDASRTSLSFVIHGLGGAGQPDVGNKDGWSSDIQIAYSTLTIANGIGQVWLVQEVPQVFAAQPDTRQVSTLDARAYWLSRQYLQWPKVDTGHVFKLYHARNGKIVATKDAAVSGADGALTLTVASSVPAAAAERFKYVSAGVALKVADADLPKLGELFQSQLLLVQETADGKVQNATTAQLAGALDEQFAAASSVSDLGVSIAGGNTVFKLWAPTAQKVQACVFDSGSAKAASIEALSRDAATGVWRASKAGDLSGKYYSYLVDVFVRGVGVVRNRVTDPYAISLTTDSKRSYIADLNAASLKPAGWDSHAMPAIAAQEDMNIYELHVRDFSVNDPTVSVANRGKYLAFTEVASNGMKHLKALAQAGMTDVHLLPVFDIASVPEAGCVSPTIPSAAADAEAQQAAVAAVRDQDCFNWGYDPYHFGAPEGSYASDAADGAKRIIEFRQMVQALHAAGLRVGMDVVYNHTSASGQNEKSVLDRVVPGYYHRLNNTGGIENSTCCANTATENAMMAKLMIDTAKLWAVHYKIDSFRFDLMAHQPRAAMEQLRTVVNAATSRDIQLIGEGWNFGEVANGARFVQASQLSLNGSGIGTFSDRARDLIRGGSGFDSGMNLRRNQGYINGLYYDDNGTGGGKTRNDLMWAADVVKVGLAGSLRDYTLTTHWDAALKLADINYNGQPAGYVSDPQEAVNYVENHDNQTLFDINAYKLPDSTSTADRARVQMLGAALNMFSQGVNYFHAGIDTLRSKSLDRNSYNAGDWFNRLDWSYSDNYFGTGAPGKDDNGDNYSVIKPLLANAGIKPTAADIAWTRDVFRDLLAIRKSSTLFRLRTADEVKQRLSFLNTGSSQEPTVIAARLNGAGYAGAGFTELLYLVNVDKAEHTLAIPSLSGKAYALHPVQAATSAADARVRSAAVTACSNTGSFRIPARSAVVCVLN
ncbi:alpha-1,6-glucosidase domain-containing protein [Chitinimonas sp. BJYL2]|uniref:alpha-1,6-glucosidase domain-containing protein n=1 Tax=Chitinimonas sp. BJYL2 TaxID=2976696 RepID=UPI0022B3FE06|nr:alpha-1,6-glucosidase domain-containing protein [Chitinimonas sp. BJYL2]